VRRLACALVAAIALVGCGGKQDRVSPAETQRLSIMLDFFPNADHVGLYAGLERGDFRRAGLDVQVLRPSDPSAPLKLLAAGKIDVAISYEPELLLARDRGAPLISVGAIVQRPLTSLISIAKGVRRVADLAGRNVGTAGIPYQSAYLKTILARAGVPARRVKQVNVGFNLVPAMLSGRVDATLGGFWNYEGIQLRQRNRHPHVTPVDRLGVPTYDELVLVVRQGSLVVSKGALVRRFVQALGRGYAAVRADPGAGVDALVARNPELVRDRRLQTASVRATLPAFFPANPGLPFGYQDRRAWERYGTWMFRQKLLTGEPHAAFAATNQYLAGQGL
jgi:putative hydroxymethylpyrimidine transport system substrate-binding protein